MRSTRNNSRTQQQQKRTGNQIAKPKKIRNVELHRVGRHKIPLTHIQHCTSFSRMHNNSKFAHCNSETSNLPSNPIHTCPHCTRAPQPTIPVHLTRPANSFVHEYTYKYPLARRYHKYSSHSANHTQFVTCHMSHATRNMSSTQCLPLDRQTNSNSKFASSEASLERAVGAHNLTRYEKKKNPFGRARKFIKYHSIRRRSTYRSQQKLPCSPGDKGNNSQIVRYLRPTLIATLCVVL